MDLISSERSEDFIRACEDFIVLCTISLDLYNLLLRVAEVVEPGEFDSRHPLQKKDQVERLGLFSTKSTQWVE